MAAGIFFFDRFLPDVNILYLFYILLAVVLTLVFSVFIKFRTPCINYCYGVVVSLCFFIVGGALVINQRKNIAYEWSSDKQYYYGIVETSPVEKGKTLCSEVNIKACSCHKDSLFTPVNRNILLYWMTDSTSAQVACGDTIVFYSNITTPVSDIPFMGFDYARYLFTKGISGTGFAYVDNWECIPSSDVLSLKHEALKCRDYVVGIYRDWNLPDEENAVISALTIGDKSELTPELKSVYSAAGTSHVLALSGLHVGILSAILFFLLYPLRRLRNGRILQFVVITTVLWIFAFISGLSPSVVRAVTMCTLYFVASVLVENGFPGFFSLSLTAFIMLLYQPFYLFDISFQLSFIAVLSILLFYPVFSSWVTSRNKIIRYIWNAVSVSMAAQLGTLPLILYYFGTFPTYFLVANLIVGPLAVCILSSTIISLIFTGIPLLSEISVYVLHIFTFLLNTSMKWIHQLDGAQITSLYFNAFQVVLAFFVLLTLLYYIRNKHALYFISVLTGLCLILGTEVYKQFTPENPSLFFARSELYIRDGRSLQILPSETGLHSINGLRIGVMKTPYWKEKTINGESKLTTLDYVYICRGFRGDIKHLYTMFEIGKIIFDSRVGERYLSFLKEQCDELGIEYEEIPEQASYRILL